MRITILLLSIAAFAADKPPVSVVSRETKQKSAAECAAIHRFNVLSRAEVKGQKEAELEPECPTPKPPTKRKQAPPEARSSGPSKGR
jgi:hypothetical protein